MSSLYDKLKHHIKYSLLKTLLVTLLFVFVYQIYNVELIRSSIEDKAFDIVNKFYLNNSEKRLDAPTVNVLKIDKYSLEERHLLNRNGFTNYGYLYPRDQIADTLETMNSLKGDKQPKVVFLDLDFSFTSLPYSRELSPEDQRLIDVLKQKRKYTLLLPKTSDFNFIEHLKDNDIQTQIANGKIRFVSVSFTINKDGLSRRYVPYQIYEGKKYWNAAISVWQMEKNYSANVLREFKLQDIVDNRIIYKETYNNGVDIKKNGFKTYRAKSYWSNVSLYSENYPVNEIQMKDAIVFIGIEHDESKDFFSVESLYAKVSGIEMHMNALMTIYKNNGPMKKVPLWYGIIIIFFVFLIVDLSLEITMDRFKIHSEEITFIVVLLLSSILFLGISILLLNVFNLWFNWLIPFILFELYEIFEISVYYYKKYKAGKKEK